MRAPPADGLDPSLLDTSGIDLSELDPSALDPSTFDPSALGLDPSRLSGIDPSQLSQGALHPIVHEALRAGAGKVALASIALAAVLFAVRMLRARMRPTERAPGPTWVAAALLLLATYLAIRAVDPLLVTTLERPSWMAEAAWAKVGWFEWKLLGRPGVALALPLADIPALALVLHIPLWLSLLWVVELILRWVYGVRPGGSVGWGTKQADLPWFYRWVGSSTARRADQRFRRWVGPLVVVLMVLHVVARLRPGAGGGAAPRGSSSGSRPSTCSSPASGRSSARRRRSSRRRRARRRRRPTILRRCRACARPPRSSAPGSPLSSSRSSRGRPSPAHLCPRSSPRSSARSSRISAVIPSPGPIRRRSWSTSPGSGP